MRMLTVALVLMGLVGCAYDDIPAAHKGRYFDSASMTCPGGQGLSGPILNPGSVWTGACDSVRLVDCSTVTQKETLNSLTKDGVQFGLDVYVRFSAKCDDNEAVTVLFDSLAPLPASNAITADQIFSTYIRPILGETVRQEVSPYVANDINDNRETILAKIQENFMKRVNFATPSVVSVQELNLSNMDFPDAMDEANTSRATQAVLKDKAIAERERVTAETETEKMRTELARQQGAVEAAKIDEIGAALARNPGYLQYQLQQSMPAIYEKAGASGNMVIAAPSPTVLVTK